MVFPHYFGLKPVITDSAVTQYFFQWKTFSHFGRSVMFDRVIKCFVYTELSCIELSSGRNCLFLQLGCHEGLLDSSLLSDIWRCSLVSHCIGHGWNDSSILLARMRFRFYFRVSACIILLGQVYSHRKMYRSGHIFSL